MAEYNPGEIYVLNNKQPIELAKQLAAGGEAYIFLIDKKPDFVARMYQKEKLDQKKNDKISKENRGN